jgi:hypothetical protein
VLRHDSYRRESYAMSPRRKGTANRNLPRVHKRMIFANPKFGSRDEKERPREGDPAGGRKVVRHK